MTPENQKLALLEWAGWKKLTEQKEGSEDIEVWRNEETCKCVLPKDIPNLSSLDTIAEFEGKLNKEEQQDYLDILYKYETSLFKRVTATSTMRLEALVRTLGLWREEKE